MNNRQKHTILAAVGVSLQTLGGICLIAAAAGIAKDISAQVKKAVYRELSKQLAEQ